MKVLMLGWEFPPFFAGGLGIACYELTKSLSDLGVDIHYVLPYLEGEASIHSHLTIHDASQYLLRPLESVHNVQQYMQTIVHPYHIHKLNSYEEYINNLPQQVMKVPRTVRSIKELYGEQILREALLYAQRVIATAKNIEFDVIHAHDWTTVLAGIELKKYFNKPLIVHVHITEHDKTGGESGSSEVQDLERLGFRHADVIVAVSNFTKSILVEKYQVDPKKIHVVHNGGSELKKVRKRFSQKKKKYVLFAGRVTLQKGPDYFLEAAKKLINVRDDLHFIIAGSGDMLPHMIEKAIQYDIIHAVTFHGFYTRREAETLFELADVFVMPSVSEPFGIVPLEAVAKSTPTIISYQSGIAEVLGAALKVNFWDIDALATHIAGLVDYEELHELISTGAFSELSKFHWSVPGKKIHNIYHEVKNK